MKIFGYGSLIDPDGINRRGMKYKYTKKDLKEATISGYTRGWNGICGRNAFLSVAPGKPTDKVNGVVFSLEKGDVKKFLASEGFYTDDPPYTLEKVHVAGMRDVFTCVESPKIKFPYARTPLYYLWEIDKYLSRKSKKFREMFHATTKHTEQTRYFFENGFDTHTREPFFYEKGGWVFEDY